MLFQAFRHAAGAHPASRGVRFGGSTYPYSALSQRAEALASGLIGLGIGPGDVVVILMRNSPDFLVLVWALFAIGALGGLIGDACHIYAGTTEYLKDDIPFIWTSQFTALPRISMRPFTSQAIG